MPKERRKEPGPAQHVSRTQCLNPQRRQGRPNRFKPDASILNKIELTGRFIWTKEDFLSQQAPLRSASANHLQLFLREAMEERVSFDPRGKDCFHRLPFLLHA